MIGVQRRGGMLGATVCREGVHFAVRSSAERVWVSLFDAEGERETDRVELVADGEGVFAGVVPDLAAGARYGLRADGPYAPELGLWFDPDKLLVDPYAVEIDRAYLYDPRLAARRGIGSDTAPLLPKAIVRESPEPLRPQQPLFRPGGLIYELSVRSFSMRHPAIPQHQRGTIAALAHPVIIEHFLKLGVSAVELMPVTAWMDERHLPTLGLRNAWGYNPVTFMALDPRLAPGGLAELRDTVAALREAGIGVILDLVFNHTAESDAFGPTLSLRGLDNLGYYRHHPGEPGRLVNDTGCGHTVACDHPYVQDLVLDSLLHFVRQAGVDGFRFDLAPVLGRSASGFDPDAPMLRAIREDPVLADRVGIAEPWDIGPGGYQLGRFRAPFLEWNDRYRDDIRRFWRGDRGTLPALATRLAGSSDVFGEGPGTRSVNFVAAHDGMTLADMLRYERKHNEANGEHNRDGHDENLSWNHGVEGESADPEIVQSRRRDAVALLATLFASRGTILLTAGDEFGRTQGGNNNAYAQDNETTWLDWEGRDIELEAQVAKMAALRRTFQPLAATAWLTGAPPPGSTVPDVAWLTETGLGMDEAAWNDPERRRLVMVLGQGEDGLVAVLVNGDRRATVFSLPARAGFLWRMAPDGSATKAADDAGPVLVPGRSIVFMAQYAADGR